MFAFLPIVVCGFYVLGNYFNYRIAILWLVLASWVFYGWWNPRYLLLLLLSILVNYSIGGVFIKKGKIANKADQKALLLIGVIFNLALLGYFKYANFFVDTVNVLAGANFHLATIILPLAISFFTFQQIAYLVDAKKGKVVESNFINYCLFVSFFPQLISGPIVHHREMMPQFNRNSQFQAVMENIAIGFVLFSIGLFKKVVIADGMAKISNPMFAQAHSIGIVDPVYAWSAILAYAFQIYFDFSGYTDMALGLGRMFGIKLPYNFNSPYKAANIFEFWNRWHMTLSRFMRHHVYIPLVRNRKLKLGHQLSLVISVLLGGLWHGANWTFIAWGGLHASYMLVNHGWHRLRRMLGHNPSERSVTGIALGVIVTFVAGMFTRVFFRADSIDTAVIIIKAMLGLQDTGGAMNLIEHYSLSGFTVMAYVALLILVWFAPNSQQWLAKYQPGINPELIVKDAKYLKHGNKTHFYDRLRFKLTPAWGVMIGIVFALALMNINHTVPFIYFQF